MNQMPKTVLVVDDDPHIVEFLRCILDDAGFSVIEAFDGMEAIAKSAAEQPDLISLDVNMPGMNGFEVCMKLKAQEETKRIPVVFVTSSVQETDYKRGNAIGAVAYIKKPVSLQDYINTIRQVLGG